MIDPINIEPVYPCDKDGQPITKSICGFRLPSYKVTSEGLQDSGSMLVQFCKGDKSNPEVFRQEGVLTVSLLQAIIEYSQNVNTGDLACRETSIAITKMEEALMWLQKRSQDRLKRNVQGSYQK